MNNGILYIVSTPIGNLEDLSFRAVRILQEVDIIAAEDTRHTKKLLNHYDIKTRLTSYYSYNEQRKGDFLVNLLEEGKQIALVSDSGTPGISDPAYYLVNKSIEQNIDVVPIPGPSALISALISSGFKIDRFIFEGFLPRKPGKRKKRLERFVGEDRAVVLYESPHRIVKTLEEIHTLLGDRQVVVARELSKKFEEKIRGRVSEVIEEVQKRKKLGEITLVIAGEG